MKEVKEMNESGLRVPPMTCPNCGAELYFKFHAGDYGEKFLCRNCGRVLIAKDDVILDLKCKVCGEKVTAKEPDEHSSDIDWLCVRPNCNHSIQNYLENPEWVEITAAEVNKIDKGD
jgi:hypothetical protein